MKTEGTSGIRPFPAEYSRREFLGVVAACSPMLGTSVIPQDAFRSGNPPSAVDRPNIVLILADDMGYSDIGCFGGEIHTPAIDRLAAGGLRFTHFHNSARCCPSRASLLTGLYPHQAGVGDMMSDQGADGYRGDLNRRCVTIAEVLRDAGYSTYAVGKWHVTRHLPPEGPTHNWPLQRGFDRFFGTITGAGSYFEPDTLVRDNTPVDPGTGFYYTDAIADRAVEFIRDHGKSRPDQPFFLYCAFTAPHWPLHAPEADIAPGGPVAAVMNNRPITSRKGFIMKPTRMILQAVALAALLVGSARPQSSTSSEVPKVTAPPESFFELINAGDRRVENRDITPHRSFYKKYIDVQGMPVVAAEEVDDRALQRTYEIVTHMLAGRPDILKAMIDQAMYLIIIGKDQVYTDMPEYRNHPNPEFQNERVRGTGGRPTSFGEENLLSLPIDRYDDESIAVHEFCHTIDRTLTRIDPTWREGKQAVYERARDKGLYKDAYAIGNAGEYWAEIAQAYFDTNRVNNWNHGPIGHREQLKAYDPEGYELVRTTFNLSPEQDWRYSWLQPLPNVTVPPAKFKIDPYYTKFTWAREFTVIGRLASDEALLHANETIRRMFAYRHDILKAIMAQGGRLVVLGRGESISDLPEFKALPDTKGIDALSRYLDYTPEMKLLVVGEENVLADPQQMNVGDSQLVRVFARAIHQITGTRPVDPEFSNRGRYVQQYELRVERMDERFDAKLKGIFEKAMAAGKWKGTSAVHDRVQYWTAGVLAYFDALGQDGAPNDAAHPIRTRELLQQYDPELFALVDETMAYGGKVDWRYRPYRR